MSDLPAGNLIFYNSVRLSILGSLVPLHGGAAKIGRPQIRASAPMVHRHCRQICGNLRASRHHEAAPPAGQNESPPRAPERIPDGARKALQHPNTGCAKTSVVAPTSASNCECAMVDTKSVFDKLLCGEKDARFRKVVCTEQPAKGGLSEAFRRGVLRKDENVAWRVESSPLNPGSWCDSEFLPPISLVAVSFDEYQKHTGARTHLSERRVRRVCATLEIPPRGIRHAPCKAPQRNSRPPGQVSEEMAE